MGRISISSKTENVIGNLNLNYHVAKGIVYFDSNGKVVKTILHNEKFESWVEISSITGKYIGEIRDYEGRKYEKAQMPNIINNNEISPRQNVYLNLVKRKDYLLCQSLIQLDYFLLVAVNIQIYHHA